MHVIEADQLREKLSFPMLIDVHKGLLNRLRDSVFSSNRHLLSLIHI